LFTEFQICRARWIGRHSIPSNVIFEIFRRMDSIAERCNERAPLRLLTFWIPISSGNSSHWHRSDTLLPPSHLVVSSKAGTATILCNWVQLRSSEVWIAAVLSVYTCPVVSSNLEVCHELRTWCSTGGGPLSLFLR
jgi:hypothetical protein